MPEVRVETQQVTHVEITEMPVRWEWRATGRGKELWIGGQDGQPVVLRMSAAGWKELGEALRARDRWAEEL